MELEGTELGEETTFSKPQTVMKDQVGNEEKLGRSMETERELACRQGAR